MTKSKYVPGSRSKVQARVRRKAKTKEIRISAATLAAVGLGEAIAFDLDIQDGRIIVTTREQATP